MPRKAKELGALDVRRIEHGGGRSHEIHAVGGVAGLLICVSPSGAKSWILRVRAGGKRREIGLGGFPDVTLAAARDKAREARAKIEFGVDPVLERRLARASLVAQTSRSLFSKTPSSAF